MHRAPEVGKLLQKVAAKKEKWQKKDYYWLGICCWPLIGAGSARSLGSGFSIATLLGSS